MEWVESTGSSIDEAKDRALDKLGVHGDDAEFEVVTDVKTGLFGRVKEEARVRARVAPATPRAKEERRRGKGRGGRNSQKGGGGRDNQRNRNDGNDNGNNRSNNKGRGSGGGNRNNDGNDQDRSSSKKKQGDSGRENAGRNSAGRDSGNRNEKKEATMSDNEATMPLPEQADLAETFVRGLAERFGTSVEFNREDIEEDEIRITVSGDDLGRMIGRRGTTAGAIDELVRTVLQRQAGSSRNGRIRVDVGGVRARRAEALANFSRAQAEEVRSSGTARSLEPMSAADRKVVHDALTDEDGVDTRSEGEDSQRRVVIVPA